MNARYNVVIVGKTGVGKSALINYLYGKYIAKTGSGKPVTENGFHPIDYEINKLPVRIFDSWGLEVGKDKQWMEELGKELKKRGTNESAENWFHSVFYCISASGHRIEDFDKQIIKLFRDEKYLVSVIFTKADGIAPEEGEKLEQELKKYFSDIHIIYVCNEDKQLMGGNKIERFGKERVELQAYNDFWNSIILRLPDRCEKVVENKIHKWITTQKKYIKDQLDSNCSCEDIRNILKRRSEILVNDIKEHKDAIKEIKDTFAMYGQFEMALGYPPASLQDQVVSANFESIIDDTKLTFFDYLLLPFVIYVVIFEFLMGSSRKEDEEALNGAVDDFINKLLNEIPKIKNQISDILRKIKVEQRAFPIH